jgi:hypothetical protein
MARSGWIALALLLATGLLGAFLLGRALQTTKGTARSKDVPTGAVVLQKQTLRATGGVPDQRVVTWQLGGKPEEPSSSLYGVSIWQGKRQIYSHRARAGALRLSVETGDFTGDAHDDVLVFDDLDGSGACGVYRVLATGAGSARQVNARLLCEDQGSIHLRKHGLLVSLGVRRDPKTAQQTHCCYRFVRRTVLRWTGGRLVTVSSRLERLSPEHPVPGGHAPGGPA